MRKGLEFKVEGLDAIRKKFKAIPERIVNEIDEEMNAAAMDYEDKAASSAPVDQSSLKQGITQRKVSALHYEITSSAPHSAYVEWGTKSRVQVPSDLATYAAQFKGKGKGSGKGFYDAILAWVKRTGLAATFSVKTRKKLQNLDTKIAEEQAAFAIYLSIMRHGVKPRPFFFKHREPIYKALREKAAATIKKELEK